MPDHPTNEIVLRANRALVAYRLSLGIAVIAAGSYFLIYLVYPQSAPLLIFLVVVVVTYAAFAQLVRLLLTGTAIILTDQGLVARIGDVNFVAWGEISGAHLESYGGLKTVALDLRDPEAVLGRMSPIRRAILRFHMKRGGKPMLYASFVQGGAEHLLRLIRERIDLRDAERARSARPVPAYPSFGTLGPKSKPSHSPTKPYAGLWGNVTLVYLVGVVVTGYVYSKGDWGWDLPQVPLGLPYAALGMAFVSFGLLAIYIGKVSMRGGSFYRSQNPILYWFCVATLLFIGIILFLPAIIPSIPGSVTLTGDEWSHCVRANAKVGDNIRITGGAGARGTIKLLFGTSTRCTNQEYPIRALVVPSDSKAASSSPSQISSKIRLELPAGWEHRFLTEEMASGGGLLNATNQTTDTRLLLSASRREGISDLMEFAVARRASQANRLIDPQQSQVLQIEINGKKAFRFEVTGALKSGLKLAYMMTVIEGATEVAILNTWTTAANFKNQKGAMAQLSENIVGL